MKILEVGKTKKKWKLQHNCTGWGNGGNGCEALLELEYSDLHYYEGSGSYEMTWGYREPAVSFKCPCCGKLTDIGRDDWPVNYRSLNPWTKDWQDSIPKGEF